jgi:hypothetical protein
MIQIKRKMANKNFIESTTVLLKKLEKTLSSRREGLVLGVNYIIQRPMLLVNRRRNDDRPPARQKETYGRVFVFALYSGRRAPAGQSR